MSLLDIENRIAVAFEQIAEDINALKVIALDREQGIVTRYTTQPCTDTEYNTFPRAVTVVAMKNAQQLDELIDELLSPTPLPTPSQDFS